MKNGWLVVPFVLMSCMGSKSPAGPADNSRRVPEVAPTISSSPAKMDPDKPSDSKPVDKPEPVTADPQPPMLPVVPVPSIDVVDKPLLWNEERRRLSLDYMKLRHGLNVDEPVITPQMIVIHATESGTWTSAFHTFYPVRMPSGERPVLQKASSLNVSAHFLVDRDGTIMRLLPETRFARHTVGLNWCAIGIENVGGTKRSPLLDTQVRATVTLVRHLVARFPIRWVIGHHEYLVFRGSPLWKETDPGYRTLKSDPGKVFMQKVRIELTDLNLESVPVP